MKKTVVLTLALIVLVLSSFTLNNGYPCHPNGDLYPCTHPAHSLGDLGPCIHTYYDNWGNLCYQHWKGDLYPCVHPVHSLGDLGPCQHICY